jgi:hypothetical protein
VQSPVSASLRTEHSSGSALIRHPSYLFLFTSIVLNLVSDEDLTHVSLPIASQVERGVVPICAQASR